MENSYKEWLYKVKEVLNKYPFIGWDTKKISSLRKKLFRSGYTPVQAASMIMLNS